MKSSKTSKRHFILFEAIYCLDNGGYLNQPLLISGDGVLKFSHLIASGLADYHTPMINGPFTVYFVNLTDKGNRIINAWFTGNRDQVRQALNDISQS